MLLSFYLREHESKKLGTLTNQFFIRPKTTCPVIALLISLPPPLLMMRVIILLQEEIRQLLLPVLPWNSFEETPLLLPLLPPLIQEEELCLIFVLLLLLPLVKLGPAVIAIYFVQIAKQLLVNNFL